MSDVLPSEYTPKKNDDCELDKLRGHLRVLQAKTAKYRTLQDAIEDALKDDTLSPTFRAKVKDICRKNSCAQTLDLEASGSTLLGVSFDNGLALTYSESLQLSRAVQSALKNKYNDVCEQFYKFTGVPIFQKSSDLCFDELIELKEKVEEAQNQYLDTLLEEQKVLEEILKIRMRRLPDVCQSKILECKRKSKVSELQAKIVDCKTKIHMFKEIANSLPAYEELMKDIQEQKFNCQRVIQHLQEQEIKYQQISSKEFDDLLRLYIQYKTSIDRKKMIYKSLCANKKM